MAKHQVQIDQEACIGCGLCVKDCVGFDIRLENGKASAAGKSCIGCGHCEAICPQGAVKLEGFTDAVEEMEQVTLDPEQYLAAIKTRRSVRKFKQEDVPENVVKMIIEAGRLAPTGGNSQGTAYVILKNKKDECEAYAVGMFRKIIQSGKKIMAALSNMELDDTFFFKGAPLVIVILGRSKVDAALAAQNMATMAEANGLGVLFSGFFTGCVNGSRKIRKIMGIGKNPKAVTTLVIGYPAVKYQRTVHREKARVKIV